MAQKEATAFRPWLLIILEKTEAYLTFLKVPIMIKLLLYFLRNLVVVKPEHYQTTKITDCFRKAG